MCLFTDLFIWVVVTCLRMRVCVFACMRNCSTIALNECKITQRCSGNDAKKGSNRSARVKKCFISNAYEYIITLRWFISKFRIYCIAEFYGESTRRFFFAQTVQVRKFVISKVFTFSGNFCCCSPAAQRNNLVTVWHKSLARKSHSIGKMLKIKEIRKKQLSDDEERARNDEISTINKICLLGWAPIPSVAINHFAHRAHSYRSLF